MNFNTIKINNDLKIHSKNCNVFDTSLAEIIGVEAALFFNKINYWISKCGRNIPSHNGKWIYNSLPSWQKQFPYFSMYKLRKTIRILEDLGLIKSIKINARKWNHTKWYTINFKKYYSFLKMYSKNPIIKDDKSVYSSNIITTKKSPTNINRNFLPFISKHNKIKASVILGQLIPLEIKQFIEDSVDVVDNNTANRSVDFQQIIITKSNYTNKSSNKKNGVQLSRHAGKKIEDIGYNEKETTNQMVELWNKVFEYSISPIKAYNNKKNQETLLNLYKMVFRGDLNNWREYACKVNSSQFLMGEKKTKNNFKAVFSWLIKEETIEKILNGEYGVGDRELDMNNVTKNIEEKKEEWVNKMDKKISEYIKPKIDETTERKEFEEYVKRNQEEKKEDKYGILRAIRHISCYSLFKTNEYAVLRESLYESYVMKKYWGLTKMEARKKIRERTKEVVDDKGINEMVIEELNKKGKEIEYFDISDGMGKIGLHSI